MTVEFKPIDTSKLVLEALKRYLKSNFQPRRECLAIQYRDSLEREILEAQGDIGGNLYREVRRRFKQGVPIQRLIDSGKASPRLVKAVRHSLYEHQVSTFEKARLQNRNVVVATGTGSGKTEAFLLPVIDDLLDELKRGELGPGIRAIVIYPMNALAADQVQRFREIFKDFPEITFGRFVGTTEATDALEKANNPNIDFLPNETLSRESMIENPPHILITNYAMLERLLLLPKWQALFTGKMRWLVMDEIHSYDGTRGVEIGLLIRRLKVRTGDIGKIKCIGLSATLGGQSEGDQSKASAFAQALFGEPFYPEDILRPVYDSQSNEDELIDLFAKENSQILAALEKEQDHIFHLFVRNPGGAFICFGPRHPKDKPRIRLQYFKKCSDCSDASKLVEIGACRKCGTEYLIGKLIGDKLLPVEEFDEQARYFRILSIEVDGIADTNTSGTLDEIDEDDIDDVPASLSTSFFCSFCSVLSQSKKCPSCSLESSVVVQEELKPDKTGRVRCTFCGSKNERNPYGPILRPVSGTDALTSVIAVAMYEGLPIDQEREAVLGEGRKLLAFSDSRQDAAYFAPYFEDTYLELLKRRAIVDSLQRLEARIENDSDNFEGYTVAQLYGSMQKLLSIIDANNEGPDLILALIRSEIMAEDFQHSLAGVGLVRFSVPRGRLPHSMEHLMNLGLSDEDSWHLINLLLESVSKQQAIELTDGIPPNHHAFAPRQVQTFICKNLENKTSLSTVNWSSKSSVGNKRRNMIERALGLNSEAALIVLDEIWDLLIKDEIFLRFKAGLFSLKNDSLRVHLVNKEQIELYKCDSCRRVSWWKLPKNLCSYKNCFGSVKQFISSADENFVRMYTKMPISGIRVSEHTAQWKAKEAEEIQRKFIEGEVNVLSCSTTFEMGVDIGSVVAVLCRNVPPTPANYVQRAGRAGRTKDPKALVVTFARRRSHDAIYASDPRRMIKGRIPVPTVNLENHDLARRHIYALALSAFLRQHQITSEDSKSFFDPAQVDSTAKKWIDWLNTKPTQLKDEIDLLGLSEQVRHKLGIEQWTWVNLLLMPDDNQRGGWLKEIIDSFDDDLSDVSNRISELDLQIQSAQNKVALRQVQVRLERIRKDIQETRWIDILANGGVLPKYGFPIDVVSLMPNYKAQGMVAKVELNRDLSLALSEYAPGNQVVAAGRILTSVGIKKPANKSFDSLRFKVTTCDACGWFIHERYLIGGGSNTNTNQECSNCGNLLANDGNTYIHPKYGFFADSDDKSASSTAKPRRLSNSRTFVSSTGSESENWISVGNGITASVSRDAEILTLNRSRFYFCPNCGFAIPMQGRLGSRRSTVTIHQDPRTGSDCKSNSPLWNVSLGHKYLTDVFRIRFSYPNQTLCVCGDLQCSGALDSAAAAIHSASIRVLGISSSDLKASTSGSPTFAQKRLMLFDTTPGGAGLAQAILNDFSTIMNLSVELVRDCQECTEDSSCYVCLRNYLNQSRHEHLSRRSALEICSFIETNTK